MLLTRGEKLPGALGWDRDCCIISSAIVAAVTAVAAGATGATGATVARMLNAANVET